jgi:hypothetical protein
VNQPQNASRQLLIDLLTGTVRVLRYSHRSSTTLWALQAAAIVVPVEGGVSVLTQGTYWEERGCDGRRRLRGLMSSVASGTRYVAVVAIQEKEALVRERFNRVWCCTAGSARVGDGRGARRPGLWPPARRPRHRVRRHRQSPLYALQTVFSIDNGAVRPTEGDVYGVISLIFWSVDADRVGQVRHGADARGQRR